MKNIFALYIMETPESLHKKYIETLKKDPLSLYEDFSKRINENGIHAEFP